MSKMFTPFRTAAGSCALLLLCAAPIVVAAQDQGSTSTATAPDNTARNRAHATTADQQKENTSDREIARKIRRAVVADSSLSTYAHNVKIIAMDGGVTLKGPVKSNEEKQSIAAKAAEVVGKDKVTDQLTVKQ
jgi:hyperosmotically inducible protein